MKIANVIWNLDVKGGTQRQALELSLRLQDEGHIVKVYAAYLDREKCYPNLLDKLDVKCLRSGADVLTQGASNLFKNMLIFWAIIKNESLYDELVDLMDKDIDVVCCHNHWTYPIGAKYKEKTGAPVVWQMNDMPFYADIGRLAGVARLFAWPIAMYFRLKHNRYIRKMDRVVVLDYINKNRLREELGVEGVVVRSGLDLERFRFNRREFAPGRLKIMAHCIFAPHRRVEDLVLALSIVKDRGVDFEFNHTGTDEFYKWYAKKIYTLVEELGLSDRVTFHGPVRDEKLIDLYSKSDVFVFPCCPQTWGLAVFEAMGCGTPVVVSTGCGASEVLTDGENALVVAPKMPEEIASAIMRLKDSPGLWARLSVNGRKFVEENIRWDLYAENMARIFDSVLRGNAREKV